MFKSIVYILFFSVVLLIDLFSLLGLPQDIKLKVLNSKKEMLYMGVDNYIYLTPLLDSIYITTTNGLIYPADSMFNIIPERSGRARLDVYSLKNQYADTVLLRSFNFLVYSLPPAKLRIGDMVITRQTELKKDFILENNEFSVYLNDDIISSHEWMVVERITLGYRKGGYFIRVNSEGNKLDDKALEEIQHIRPGQEISIHVRVKCQGDIRKNIPVYRTRLY
ncbi:MAG: hypothetical protein ACOC2F_01425 [Bacteroidota bacterium]